MPLLSTFRKLNHLVIPNPQDINLTLLHVLDVCQQLKNLDFTSFVAVPNHADNLFQEMGGESTTSNSSNTDWTSLAHSQYLESLAIDVPSLTLTYIKYLTNCLPNTLTRINLAMSNTDLHSWIKEYGINTVMEVFKRLKVIGDVKIEFKGGGAGRKMISRSDKMVQLYKILDALKSHKKKRFPCVAHYMFGIFPQSQEMNTELYLDTKRLYFTNFFTGPDPLPNPNFTMVVPRSEVVDALKFQVIYINFSMDVITRLIDYTATNYPYLARFSIKTENALTDSLKAIVASGGSRRIFKRTDQPSTSNTSRVTTTSLEKAFESTTTADDRKENMHDGDDGVLFFTNLQLEGITFVSKDLGNSLVSRLPYINFIQYTSSFKPQNDGPVQGQQAFSCLSAFLNVTPFAKLVDLQILVEIVRNGRNFVKFDFVDDKALTGCYEIKKISESKGSAVVKKNKYELCSTTAEGIDKYETKKSF